MDGFVEFGSHVHHAFGGSGAPVWPMVVGFGEPGDYERPNGVEARPPGRRGRGSCGLQALSAPAPPPPPRPIHRG